MRLILTLAALAVAMPAQADPSSHPAHTIKLKSVKVMQVVTCPGPDPLPVATFAVVKTRDGSIKRELGNATDAHLMDATARR